MVLENEYQAMDEEVINPLDAILELEDSDNVSTDESFVFSVSTENLSDLDEIEVIDTDSAEVDNKIMQVDEVNNVRFLAYECREPVCLTQHYYIIHNQSLCPSCFFETLRGVPTYIHTNHITEHSSGTADNLNLLGCVSYAGRHTAENIQNKIQRLIAEWKLDNRIAAVVTDNASNIKAAVRIGGWQSWGCFAHSLNFVTQSALKEIREVVEKVKNIMKNAIISTLTVLNSSVTEYVEPLQNEDWTIAEQSIKVLEIFNLVTTAISSEQKVSASSIIFYYTQITKHMNSFDINTMMPHVQNMVKKLQFELIQRFSDIEEHSLIAQATILYPRFKKFGFIGQRQYLKAVEALYRKVANTKLLTQKENEEENIEQPIQNIPYKEYLLQNLWKDFDNEVQQHQQPSNPTASAIVEVDKYLEEIILPRKDSFGISQDPLLWWHQRKQTYPKLYQIM
ncbi:unnamed protein product [Diabrotica balteata]|uniref:HAT C-terminal dimerisation domain-containing protein n=1 Tax=Diabrotica balteata TaxID=107213 RepID=A0A9N9T662_DIABA|nr:unnamed protein product [Diabrotica balteata]